MKWFEDRVEKEYRDRVLQAAQGELEKLRESHKPARRFLFMQMAGGFAALFVGVLAVKRLREAQIAVPNDPQVASDLDPQMLGELALVEDLEFWQDLKFLESAPELDEEA